VCVDSSWSSVCWDGWDDTEAAVVCRQLNFTGGGKSLSLELVGWWAFEIIFIPLLSFLI